MKKKIWKGRPPRVKRIGVIDDDSSARDTLVELIRCEFPKLTVKGFESIFKAYEGMTNYDYLLIDISAVAPMMLSDTAHAWAAISKYADTYPGTEFVLITAASRNCVEDVIDDCVNHGGIARERFHYGGFLWDSNYTGESVKDNLRRLIRPVDCDWTEV